MGIWARVGRRKGRYARCFLTGLVFLGLANGAAWLGGLQGVENRIFDFLTYWKTDVRDPNVVIVAIDEEAFDSPELRRTQPLNRAYVGDLIETLSRFSPAAIIVDIRFDSTTDETRDTSLVAALKLAASRTAVIMPGTFDDKPLLKDEVFGDGSTEAIVTPFFPRLREELRDCEGIYPCTPQVLTDKDTVIRRFIPAVIGREGELIPAMSVAALAHACGIGPKALSEAGGEEKITIDFSQSRIPDLKARRTVTLQTDRRDPISYGGSFMYMTAGTVAASSSVPMEAVAENNPFRDCFVFVGGTFEDSRDFHATPLGRMAGVEIQANILSTLIKRSGTAGALLALGLGLQVVFCAIVSVFYTAYRPGRATVYALLLAGAVLLPLSYKFLSTMNYFYNFTPTLVAVALSGLYSDRQSRRQVERNFSAHVAPEVVKAVYEDQQDILRGGYREATILFCDLRGFTWMSYNEPAETLVSFINEFYEKMTAVCFQHRGMVNKFIGDCLLVVFNAPLDDPHHIDNALAAGAGMIQAMRELQKEWKAKDARMEIDMGVGIHTGRVFCGSVGSEQKKEYGVIGKDVIVSYELEQMNKKLGSHMLVSKTAYDRSSKRYEAVDRGSFEIRKYGEFVEVLEIRVEEKAG